MGRQSAWESVVREVVACVRARVRMLECWVLGDREWTCLWACWRTSEGGGMDGRSWRSGMRGKDRSECDLDFSCGSEATVGTVARNRVRVEWGLSVRRLRVRIGMMELDIVDVQGTNRVLWAHMSLGWAT